MYKKIISISLLIVFMISGAACSNGESAKPTNPTTSTTQEEKSTHSEHELTTEKDSKEQSIIDTTKKPFETTNRNTITKPSNTKRETKNEYEGYTLCENCSDTWFEGDYRYCSSCKCSLSTCDNLKSGNSDDYCSEHICGQNGCLGSRENGSLFCRSHNCDAANCGEAQATNSRYCLQHKCSECYKQKDSGSNYCSSHNCAWSGCVSGKSGSSGYCLEHKCNESGCLNPKQNSANYCSNHDCERCTGDRVGGSRYCIDCKCSIPGCTNWGTSKIGGINYCGNHVPK